MLGSRLLCVYPCNTDKIGLFLCLFLVFFVSSCYFSSSSFFLIDSFLIPRASWSRMRESCRQLQKLQYRHTLVNTFIFFLIPVIKDESLIGFICFPGAEFLAFFDYLVWVVEYLKHIFSYYRQEHCHLEFFIKALQPGHDRIVIPGLFEAFPVGCKISICLRGGGSFNPEGRVGIAKAMLPDPSPLAWFNVCGAAACVPPPDSSLSLMSLIVWIPLLTPCLVVVLLSQTAFSLGERIYWSIVLQHMAVPYQQKYYCVYGTQSKSHLELPLS